MQRREFVGTAAAGLSAAGVEAMANAPEQSGEQAAGSQYFLLRCYYMRSGPQVDRTTKFLSGACLPAAKRAGAKTVGFFSPVIGEHSPYILALAAYASLGAMESAEARMGADKDYQAAADAYDIIGDLAYIRIETILLRAFDGIPGLTAPANDGKRAARIFEMRTYESPSEKAGRRKIKMFEDGEAAIFRRLGMAPVFFGKGVTGNNLPSLTYMLSYEDLAARDRLWKAFGGDAEWQKLRAQPGLSDAEIVSNISNRILRPLAFSEIR